ncbi:LAGLIDADG family homing endonuclease [Streptomyces sp. NPDC054849]
MAGDNEYISPTGKSDCRQCMAIRSRSRRAKQAEEDGRILRGPHGRIADGQPKSMRTQFRERARRGETKPLFRYPWNDHFFDDWSGDMAWVLGIIWADGYLDRGNTVEVCSKDLDLVETIAELIAQPGGVRVKNAGQHWRICFSSSRAAEQLRSLGLVTAKSFLIDWPLRIQPQYEAAFVRGLLDGDGTVSLTQSRRGQQRPDLRVELNTASEALAASFYRWCEAHELVSHIHGREIYKVGIQEQASLRKLYGLLYPSTALPHLARKRALFEAWLSIPRAKSGRPTVRRNEPQSGHADSSS